VERARAVRESAFGAFSRGRLSMTIFSEEKKREVLDALFELATNTDKGNVPAIKLYLELAGEQLPQDALTMERIVQLIRDELNAETREEAA
jgi:hypothetical protein